MINVCGFTIGCFALPFVQNFFGPGKMIIACLFDIGNAFMVTGGSFAFTSSVLQTNPDEKQNIGTLLKKIRQFNSLGYLHADARSGHAEYPGTGRAYHAC